MRLTLLLALLLIAPALATPIEGPICNTAAEVHQATTAVTADLRDKRTTLAGAVTSWKALQHVLDNAPDSPLAALERKRLGMLLAAADVEQRQGTAAASGKWASEVPVGKQADAAFDKFENSYAHPDVTKMAEGEVFQSIPADLDGKQDTIQLVIHREGGAPVADNTTLLRLRVVDAGGKTVWEGPTAGDSPMVFGTMDLDGGDIDFVGDLLHDGHVEVAGTLPHGDISARWRILRWEHNAFSVVHTGWAIVDDDTVRWNPPGTDFNQAQWIDRFGGVTRDGDCLVQVINPAGHGRFAMLRPDGDGFKVERWLSSGASQP